MLKKIIITIVGVSLLAGLLVFVSINPKANDDGQCVILVYDEELIYEKELTFKKGQTLFELMNDNFTIVMDGNIILSIDDVKTDFVNDYIAIYINDLYANKGIRQIELTDKDVISFRVTKI